jgi:hypothetical protein
VPSACETISAYLQLARAGRAAEAPAPRDGLLVLAAAAASELGLEPIAEGCRQLVLEHNPRHLVGRWATVDSALADEEFQGFLKQLRRRCPPERAEHLLTQLGIGLADEREQFADDVELAAWLLLRLGDPNDRLVVARSPSTRRSFSGAIRSSGEGRLFGWVSLMWVMVALALLLLAALAVGVATHRGWWQG